MNKAGKLLIQALRFIGVSGIGWLIDFSIYVATHKLLGDKLTVSFGAFVLDGCNMISMLCGVTFVFFVSTRKTFSVNLHKYSLKTKYFVYITYQLVMLFLVSYVIGIVTDYFIRKDVASILANLDISVLAFFTTPEIIAKICVTPVTMILNFLFMKVLTERI